MSHSEGNSENQNAERKAQESMLMRVPRIAKALGNCVLKVQGRLNSKIIAWCFVWKKFWDSLTCRVWHGCCSLGFAQIYSENAKEVQRKEKVWQERACVCLKLRTGQTRRQQLKLSVKEICPETIRRWPWAYGTRSRMVSAWPRLGALSWKIAVLGWASLGKDGHCKQNLGSLLPVLSLLSVHQDVRREESQPNASAARTEEIPVTPCPAWWIVELQTMSWKKSFLS